MNPEEQEIITKEFNKLVKIAYEGWKTLEDELKEKFPSESYINTFVLSYKIDEVDGSVCKVASEVEDVRYAVEK